MNRSASGLQTDDLALMHRIAQRDPEALRALYDRYSGLVLAICLRILRERTEAEQLLVDIFAETWERSARFDASRGSPATYLATMARSRAIDRLRARKSQAALPLDSISAAGDTSDKSAGPVQQTLAGEDQSVVRSALDTLDTNQRQAVEMAFYDGLSHSEIAQKLNKPLGTVKTHIRLGLIRLRDLLRSHWEGGQGLP